MALPDDNDRKDAPDSTDALDRPDGTGGPGSAEPGESPAAPTPAGRAVLRVLCLGDGFTTAALKRMADAGPVLVGPATVGPSRNGVRLEVRALSRAGRGQAVGFVPDIIVDTIPPVKKGGRLLNPLYREAIAPFEDAIFVHLSSTSVYAADAADGAEYVDEGTAPASDDERGRSRLELEEAILGVRPQAVILRCGGIYGPGRCLPLSLASGSSRHLSFEENRYVARIHVHDLGRLILASGVAVLAASHVRNQHDGPLSLFPGFARANLICAVDPNPSAVAGTLQFIHEEWGIALPDAALRLMGDGAGRVRGRRVRSLYAGELLGRFDFPDYRAGFRHAMKEWRPGER